MAVRKVKGAWIVDFRWKNELLRRWSPLNTKGGAEAYEAHLRQLVAQHGTVKQVLLALKPEKETRLPTFAAFAERWLREYVDVNNGASERYNKRRSLAGHLLPTFGSLHLDQITSVAIERFKGALLARGLKAKTVNHHLCVLSRCLASAHEWSVINEIPKIRRLKEAPPVVHFLRPEEVSRLLSHIDDVSLASMVLLAVRTGLRFSEMIALRWADTDLDRGYLCVRRAEVRGIIGATKSHRDRYIPLTADLVQALRRLPRTSETVFGREGKSSSHPRLLEKLRSACHRADVPNVGWHGLRHSFATALIGAGAPVPTVKELLGHATLEMTMRYTHMTPEHLRAAVDLLDPPNLVIGQ